MQDLGAPGQGAAGADPGDDGVDPPTSVDPDFLGRGVAVNLGIGRVGELLQHDRAGGLFDQFLGPLYGPPHAQLGRGEFYFGAQQLEHLAALLGHAFRHRQDQPVSLGGADESQRNPGVARGRLDQGGAGLDAALAFGGLDHGNPDAVLDRAERIEKFALCQDLRLHPLVFGQSAEPHQGRGPDGLDDAVIDAAAKFGLKGKTGGRGGGGFYAHFSIVPSKNPSNREI